MADSAAPGGAKLPQTFGEKLSFSLPVILVTLVLAIGIGFAITMIIDGKTFDKLSAQVEEEKTQRTKKVGELEKANSDLQKTVEVITKNNDDLAKTNKVLKEELGKVGETLSNVSTEYKKFVEGQVQLDQTQTKDIASTKEDVNKVDR